MFCFLLVVVVIKMENRRMGYKLFKLYGQEKKVRDEQRADLVRLARLNSPERIRQIATRVYKYDRAKKGQVVRIAAQGSAVIK